MDIPQDLVYKVITDYKKQLDEGLVEIFMEREQYVKVHSKSQAGKNILAGLENAVKVYLEGHDAGEE